MIFFTIVFLVSGQESRLTLPTQQPCTSSPSIKLDFITLDNFPPEDTDLSIHFKATIVYPVYPVKADLIIAGSDGFSFQDEAHFYIPPVPYPPVDFIHSVKVSTNSTVSYVLKIYLSSFLETITCFQKTFAIWKDLS